MPYAIFAIYLQSKEYSRKVVTLNFKLGQYFSSWFSYLEYVKVTSDPWSRSLIYPFLPKMDSAAQWENAVNAHWDQNGQFGG